MVQSSRSKAYFSEDFKLSVLKDMYENNLSVYSTAKNTTVPLKWTNRSLN